MPPIQKALHDSIYQIECSFMQRREEQISRLYAPAQNWAFQYEPTQSIFAGQARQVEQIAVQRNMPLVWLTRNNSALDTLTNFLCYNAKIDASSIAQGHIEEVDFLALTSACGVLAVSNLHLYDVDAMDCFEEIMIELLECKVSFQILCDWNLSIDEQMLAEMVAKNGKMNLCFPG